MKNGKRIVLEASEGITFRVQKEKDEIVIKKININKKEISIDISPLQYPS